MIYRQGDVLLVKCNEIPKQCEEVKIQDRIVLAYGEVTGHAHAIYDTKKAVLMKYANSDNFFLLITESVDLKHEEHDKINLPSGNYQVIRQREYTPEKPRYVAD